MNKAEVVSLSISCAVSCFLNAMDVAGEKSEVTDDHLRRSSFSELRACGCGLKMPRKKR